MGQAVVIHLDANFLILGSIPGSAEATKIKAWLRAGEPLATSAVAWMEFVTGPVEADAVRAIGHVLQGRVQVVDRDTAELAARLVNAIGRKRAMKYDCLIAAAAIQDGARLASNNRASYLSFASHGLALA